MTGSSERMQKCQLKRFIFIALPHSTSLFPHPNGPFRNLALVAPPLAGPPPPKPCPASPRRFETSVTSCGPGLGPLLGLGRHQAIVLCYSKVFEVRVRRCLTLTAKAKRPNWSRGRLHASVCQGATAQKPKTLRHDLDFDSYILFARENAKETGESHHEVSLPNLG